jgi:hypothetical protein
MSIKPSGLWCDLCNTPILSGEYWDIGVNGKKGFHACLACKVRHDGKKQAALSEGEANG